MIRQSSIFSKIHSNMSSFLRTHTPVTSVEFLSRARPLIDSLPYYLHSALIALAYWLIWDHAWVLMFILYAVIPLLDQIVPPKTQNPTKKQASHITDEENYYQLPLIVGFVLYNGLLLRTLAYFQNDFEATWSSCVNLAGLFIYLVSMGGVVVVSVHELVHQPHSWCIWGAVGVASTFNMHIFYEHVHSHHKIMATPQDASTARIEQSLYDFSLGATPKQCRIVYDIEKQKGKAFYSNFMVVSTAIYIILPLAVYYVYGLASTVFYVTQAVLGKFIVDGISYLSHYGQLRQKLPNGQYEPARRLHSWVSPSRISSYLLINVERHSDHHESSTLPYQALNYHEEASQCPYGWVPTLITTLFPAVWFDVMKPLALAYKSRDQDTIREESQVAREKAWRFYKKVIVVVFFLMTVTSSNGLGLLVL